MGTSKISPNEMKRVKALGFLRNKNSEDEFSGRVITRNGKITPAQLKGIAEAAEKYGREVTFTTRLTVEVNGISYDDIENFREALRPYGLETGGTGAKMRPVVSCKGTTCQYGLIDTFALSEAIHETYFVGWGDVITPHKFKVAVGGCPNSCAKPELNDVGITGQLEPNYHEDKCRGCGKCPPETICPTGAAVVNREIGKLEIDEELCIHCGLCVGRCNFDALIDGTRGYLLTLGGTWGKRKHKGVAYGEILRSQEEVLAVIGKAILAYREQGIQGERLHDTASRIGYEEFFSIIVGDEILERKEQILNQYAELEFALSSSGGGNMKHLGTKRIETERLILRRFEERDKVPAYENYCTDKEVTKFLTWLPHESVEVTEEVLSTWIESYGRDDFYQWAITLKGEDEPIGSISVVAMNEGAELVEIGYCLGTKWWNQGIMTEALAAVMDYLFREVEVNKVVACHDVENPASGEVMKKCGLTYEGTLKASKRNNRGIVDNAYYGLIQEAYRGVRK